MPMPKRETVMTNFKTQLKTITIANEYSFDANVYDWREAPVDKSECPAIICRDTVETIIVAIGTHLHNLCVQMELISMEGTTPVSRRSGCTRDHGMVGTAAHLGRSGRSS